MGDTVVITESEDEATEEVEEATEAVADAVEDMADAVEDAVMDAATIDLVERVTRIETALELYIAPMIEGLGQRIQELEWRVNMAQESADRANETVAEVAEEAADAIQETTEDVVEATPEITEDEVPTAREHPFFRKWGKNK